MATPGPDMLHLPEHPLHVASCPLKVPSSLGKPDYREVYEIQGPALLQRRRIEPQCGDYAFAIRRVPRSRHQSAEWESRPGWVGAAGTAMHLRPVLTVGPSSPCIEGVVRKGTPSMLCSCAQKGSGRNSLWGLHALSKSLTPECPAYESGQSREDVFLLKRDM